MTTDIKRLTEAFTALTAQGIICHHNFMCCGGCAATAAANKYDALPDDVKATVIGVVYYHEQCAEDAHQGRGLDLSYGPLPYEGTTDEEAKTAAIGQKVVEALRQAGLEPVWNGDPDEVIEIPNFKVELWQLPRGLRLDDHDDD